MENEINQNVQNAESVKTETESPAGGTVQTVVEKSGNGKKKGIIIIITVLLLIGITTGIGLKNHKAKEIEYAKERMDSAYDDYNKAYTKYSKLYNIKERISDMISFPNRHYLSSYEKEYVSDKLEEFADVAKDYSIVIFYEAKAYDTAIRLMDEAIQKAKEESEKFERIYNYLCEDYYKVLND